MNQFASKKLIAIYTDIGRGHPNYMDSTLRAMRIIRTIPPEDVEITSVFKLSRGFSLMAWKTVRKIYRQGAQGGLLSSLYNHLRRGSKTNRENNRMAQILGRDLRRVLNGYNGIVLVAHPLLAQILADICRVFYIHGEIAAPYEFDLSKSEKIFVPLEETARNMIAQGVPEDRIVITGLMLEPELVPKADIMRENRVVRMNNSQPPTFALYNSGAYPKEHVIQILKAAKYILGAKLGRVILSTGCNPGMYGRYKSELAQFNAITSTEAFNNGGSSLLFQHDPDREKLTLQELELLPSADLIVMAAHERINWSVGLGIPAIFLEPDYGSFSPLNRQYAGANGKVFPHENNEITAAIDNFLIARKEKTPILFTKHGSYDINGSYRTGEIIQSTLAMDRR